MRIVYSSNNYKNSIYRSILAIIVGVGLIVWPHVAANYMIVLIGALFFIIGLVSFITSYRLRAKMQRDLQVNGETNGQERNPYVRRLISVNGIGSMILGAILMLFPEAFVSIVMFLLGIILIIAAVGQLVMLGAAKQLGYVSPISYLFPILILGAGVVIIVNPFNTVAGIFILFGATSIFYGVTDLFNQYGINKMRKRNFEHNSFNNDKTKREDGTEDIDYEEIK